jgi:hypothetical protein
VAYRREKEEALKNQSAPAENSLIFEEVRATMEQMNIPQETIKEVNSKIENEARKSVQEIQGVYYDTVD